MKIHFLSSNSDKAQKAYSYFSKKYSQFSLENADVIVSLSGDGMVLRALHENFYRNVPVYGMNCGKIGFLTNELNKEIDLIERINNAFRINIYPLVGKVYTFNNRQVDILAINEIYLFRTSHQSAKIKVSINDKVRIPELICDGILASSPIGSTAYNSSVGGPIIPFDSDLISLIGISPFLPKNWHGALLSGTDRIEMKVIDPIRRPVSTIADYIEIKDTESVSVSYDKSQSVTLLIDSKEVMYEKISNAQFS